MSNHNERGETSDILNYIKDQLAQKKTKEEITNNLKQTGWHENDINKAFFDIEMCKKKRKKKIITNLFATIFAILALAFILLFAPNSPVKYKHEEVHNLGKTVVSEPLDPEVEKFLYDNMTGKRKNIPVKVAKNIVENEKRMKELSEMSMRNFTNLTK
ncbi:MAG: hypothetical protein N3D84_00820 [Candidatus Woesearchaeota archaeon]|nr:hypothetical protein [Candidatus Woesearchaeota archaeon]